MSPIDPDYVDVAERITDFYAKWPEGRVQTISVRYCDFHQTGFLAKAYAYRTPDDPLPGVGTAWEPAPGKTNFTRDSEVQNAETSAWGRAIVACGIGSKKIATRQDIAAREGADENRRAHEQTSTLNVREPNRTLISPAQKARLWTIARSKKTGDPLSDASVHAIVQAITGQEHTSKIQRYQYDKVIAVIQDEKNAVPK